LAEQVAYAKFRVALQVLAEIMTSQPNRESKALVNPNVGMVGVRIRDFTRMNPPQFIGSKVDEDPQDFID